MGKIKSKWICQSCGYQSASFLGRCPECNDFGTFTEEVEQELTKTVGQNSVNFNKEIQKPTLLKEVREENAKRISSGFKEFDRILGGGLTAGSLTLLAGDPGIGKSTLILQTVGNISSTGVKTLYICAEESTSQVKLRAKRLEVDSEHLYLSSENSLENIINFIEENKPEFLVIDSIQSIFTNLITSSAGTVSQIRECTNILMKLAKQKNITTIVIGHVTKDGNIAGPKVLEHMVDTVVNFEGDRYKTFRVLRAIKNRFGSTSEIGIFNMEEDGLREVLNPNEMFLTSEVQTSGSAIISALEGTRVLLLEVQALTSTSSYTNP
ncbi:DNA repair protein RadA, partial [bacterium]|nr:DNA repair protein RadA [bacterium]